MPDAPRERLVEHALALVVQGEMDPIDDVAARGARLALNQWSGKSAEHNAAAQEARRRWDSLGGMAEELRTHFQPTDAAAQATRKGRQRRKLLLSVAALLGTGVVAGRGALWYWEQPLFAAAYATPTAQVREVRLADGDQGEPGSRLDMAPQSAVDVALYRGRRSVRMARGEVRFDVARDTGRPFDVLTRAARIEVVGTAFTVRDRGGAITVGVEHGHVRVQPLRPAADGGAAQPLGAAIDLRPGQLLDIDGGGQAQAVRQADTAALSAWRDGWLVFDNTRLGDALATVNAYRGQPIRSTDGRVDALRLSGRFRADDSASLVAVLPNILPVHARVRADASVELSPR